MKKILSLIITCAISLCFSMAYAGDNDDRHTIWYASSLTGGGTGALDGVVSGVSIGPKDSAIVVNSSASGFGGQYYVTLTSEAERSPIVIRPDDVGGGVTSWHLLGDEVVFSGASNLSGTSISYPYSIRVMAGASLYSSSGSGTIVNFHGPVDAGTFAWLNYSKNSTGVTPIFHNNITVHPEWFLVSGVSDQTPINAAVASFPLGGTVRLTKSSYIIGGTIDVDSDDVTLEIGSGTTVTLLDDSNVDMVSVTGNNCVIKGGSFDGNRSNQTAGDGIKITGGDGSSIINTHVVNAYTYGIQSANASRIKIEGNYVEDSGNIGIFVENNTSGTTQQGVSIINNTVDRLDIGASITAGGIQVHGDNGSGFMNHVRIANNNILLPRAPSGASISIEVWGEANHATITGNSTNGGSMGISSSGCSNTAVNGNSILGASGYGLEVASISMYNTLAGNSINNNKVGSNVPILVSGSTGTVVQGNSIVGMGNVGIQVQTDSNLTTISGNVVEQTTATYAVNIIDSDYVSVTGNTLNGNKIGTKAIMINECSNITVTGNIMTGFTQNSVYCYADQAYTMNYINITGNNTYDCASNFSYSLTGGGVFGTDVSFMWNTPTSGYQWYDTLNLLTILHGSASPEASKTAGIGSLYLRTGGGANTTLYVKESGVTSTGWVAK